MTHQLRLHAPGTPAPQGSKRAFAHRTTGRVVMVADNNKTLKTWRGQVRAAALTAIGHTGRDTCPLPGPLAVDITFLMPRPKYHYRTGRHAHELRPNAPVWVDKKPDLDKLIRSTLDSLTDALVYDDDSQVAQITAQARYAGPDQGTGADITITTLDTPAPAAEALEQGVLL